jgi:hypothetical protein
MYDIGLRVRKKMILKYECVCVCVRTNSVWMVLSANPNIGAMWTDKMSAVSINQKNQEVRLRVDASSKDVDVIA